MQNNITIIPIIAQKYDKLKSLCAKYEVSTLYLFGSGTNEKFTEKSDLDFLVKFSEIPILDYADYFFDFMHELEELYDRNIDLITEQSLTNPYLIKSINKNKKLIYARTNSEISAWYYNLN